MTKEKQDLIDDLARKMAVNDLMYDYRIRAITEFAEKLENLFAIPVVSGSACPKGQYVKGIRCNRCDYKPICNIPD
jgi:hypothetical protein